MFRTTRWPILQASILLALGASMNIAVVLADAAAYAAGFRTISRHWVANVDGDDVVRHTYLFRTSTAAYLRGTGNEPPGSFVPRVRFIRPDADWRPFGAAELFAIRLDEDIKLTIYDAGWPMRSLWGWSAVDRRTWPRTEHRTHVVIMPRDGARAVAIPVRPRWSGFVVNTVLYACLAAFLWHARACARTLRQSLRRRRGLCPSCGYARTGLARDAPCPECGLNAGPSG